MQTTRPLFGASRLPLTTKRGNKDYYKGTRQAIVPGAANRSGLPGRHTPHQAGKFQLDDAKVRYYVPPPSSIYKNADKLHHLAPYVSNQVDPLALARALPKLPPFGPMPQSTSRGPGAVFAKLPGYEALKDTNPAQWRRMQDPLQRKREFAREYASMKPEHKEALKAEARRNWWAKYQKNIEKVKELETMGVFKQTTAIAEETK